RSGKNVHGEADFVSSFGVSSILDAGCGTGRVAIELARRSHEVVGVDADQAMLSIAEEKEPDLTWVLGDLAEVDLGRTFDAIVMAGNVMIFLAPGTESAVISNMARHLRDGGLCIAGFSLAKDRLDLEGYDRFAAESGLSLVERWSTWDR